MPKKIVTSQYEGSYSGTNASHDPNSFIYDDAGVISYKDAENTPAQEVLKPGTLYGWGYDGGESGGRPTITLRPDIYASNDQQIVIDATVPNHIHIRAGGLKDASNAELILGAEQANVKVVDWNHQVSVNTYNSGNDTSHNWTFVNDGTMYGPGEGSALLVTGVATGAGINSLPIYSNGSMTLTANGGDMNLYMDGGLYIGASASDNQILKRSDLNNVPVKALVPETASSTGSVGQVAWDTDYFYVCVATNTWKRTALSTWA